VIRGLLTTLETPSPSLARYILRVAPLTVLPSFLILGFAAVVFRLLGRDTTFPAEGAPSTGLLDLVGVVVAGPVLETLGLALVLTLLGLCSLPVRWQAAVAALLWGALHGLFHPLWFFGSVWGFFAFSAAFLAWRRVSGRHAYVAAATLHGVHNLAVVIVASVWPQGAGLE